jgi:RHS repeat-associated protein
MGDDAQHWQFAISITYAPDGHGRPRRVRIDGVNHANNPLYHPSGQLAALDYGNGLSYSATINARQQMTSQRVSAGASDRSRYSYGRDALGRVTTITDHVRSSQNRSYGYDPLGRLVTASGEWGAGSYTYDLLNNIREKALGLRTVELEYDASGRLDRYRDTDAGFTWLDQLYDGRGNVTSDGVHGFSYDTSGQPYAISGGATGSFIYDAHRRRVKQTLNGQTIYTIYGLDGTLYYRDNATTGETTDYVRMGSHTVGRMDEAGVFTWTHSDHLGSASAATDASGAIIWRESYLPFGEAIEDPAANRDEAGFTGHIRDAATGLTYAQARYYNPVTARFLAPDPVGFADMGPGYFNRYAYTANDPVNLVDPTGMAAMRADPGDRFPTEEEAVDDFFDHVDELESADNTRSVEERGADFQQDPDTGEYFYDDVQTGTTGEVDIIVDRSAVAVAHTHPSEGDRRTDRRNERLSPDDRRMMTTVNDFTGTSTPVRAYLQTPSGRRVRWDGTRNYRGQGEEY